MSFSSVRLPAPKKGPPAKKMVHLESINTIPSLYPEFRNVLWTGEGSQLVVMTIPVGGDIGEEVSAESQPRFTSGRMLAPEAGLELGWRCGSDVIDLP